MATEKQLKYLTDLCEWYRQAIKDSKKRNTKSQARLAEYRLMHPGVGR